MYKVDLHTHSTASPDGGISAAQYEQALRSGKLDYIAVTDHNTIEYALELQNQLGEQIIVGEEIMTSQGEIVGLFLREVVQPGQTAAATLAAIKAQGGLVYIPHPFETVRKGVHPAILESISDSVDVIEVCNGRAVLQNRSAQAVVWARINSVPGAASSDAHGSAGLGDTFTRVSEPPTRANLVDLIARGTPHTKRPSVRALLYPKYHRTRKKIQSRIHKGSA